MPAGRGGRHILLAMALQEHLHVAEPMALVERQGAEAVRASAVQFLLTGVAGVFTVLFVTLFMLAMGGPLVRAWLAQSKPDRRRTMLRRCTIEIHRLSPSRTDASQRS